MIIKLSKKFIEAASVSDEKFYKQAAIDVDKIRYSSHVSIDAEEYKREDLEKLFAIAQRLVKEKVFGAGEVVRNVKQWLELLDQPSFDEVKIRKVEFFKVYLINAMKDKERKFIYHYDDARGVMYCSYIYDIEYHEKDMRRDYTVPEHCTFHISWEEFGEQQTQSFSFYQRDVFLMTVTDALKRKGFYFEDEIVRKQYLDSIEQFEKIADGVGKQFLATGSGTEENDNRRDSWWRRSSSNINLVKDGEPSNVVVDVFQESDEETSRNSRKSHDADEYYWHNMKFSKVEREDEEEAHEGHEIPIHPNLVVFALRKQVRLRVHVSQLTEYIYNPKLGESLVLPDDSKRLIETLAGYTGNSKDIISNKGGGAIVMCAGVPGTGKTLTSEVYAEVMEKPLYSVQCSQLGLQPDDLEESLLKIFARAARWNAILLLDEADVYVHERGDNIEQNAIVGVFLRVLEYYNGVMFMTTNRSESIDDAVLSRCIAKIEYLVPTATDLKKMWTVLAKVQGLKLSDEVTDQLVKKYAGISGRDVKNLLKLASLVTPGKITVETIDFVKKFKPTK